jgi:hypothetical protein
MKKDSKVDFIDKEELEREGVRRARALLGGRYASMDKEKQGQDFEGYKKIMSKLRDNLTPKAGSGGDKHNKKVDGRKPLPLNLTEERAVDAEIQTRGKRTKVREERGLSFEEKCLADWDNNPELRAEFGGNIARFYAYARAEKAGRTRIINYRGGKDGISIHRRKK